MELCTGYNTNSDISSEFSVTNNAKSLAISGGADTNTIITNIKHGGSRNNSESRVTKGCCSYANLIKQILVCVFRKTYITKSSPLICCGVNPTNILALIWVLKINNVTRSSCGNRSCNTNSMLTGNS